MHILAVFGYLNPMGFIPILCLVKKLFLIRVDSEEKVENVKINSKSKKVMVLINLIKNYRKPGLTALDCGEFSGTIA